MISVFFGFVLGDDALIRMLGLGLATAILVDATVVRLGLVPATMKLLGDANGWLPGWLDRVLPRVDIDGGGRTTPTTPGPSLRPPPIANEHLPASEPRIGAPAATRALRSSGREGSTWATHGD